MTPAKVMAFGLLIAFHCLRKFLNVRDYYLPNDDCPADNLFGLRQQWHVKDLTLAVKFSKNSPTSSLEIVLADWAAWDKEQREVVGGVHSMVNIRDACVQTTFQKACQIAQR